MTVLARPFASSLTTADGITLSARTWSHPEARAVIVLVHGFAASAEDPAVVRQAEVLQAAGFDVLAYDSRGHGDSDGLCTIGDLERQDVAAAVAAVRATASRRDVPVILLGASMGAIAALRYAATTDDQLTGVVCVSSPSTWRPPRTARGVLAAGRRPVCREPSGSRMALRQRQSPPEWPQETARRDGRGSLCTHLSELGSVSGHGTAIEAASPQTAQPSMSRYRRRGLVFEPFPPFGYPRLLP